MLRPPFFLLALPIIATGLMATVTAHGQSHAPRRIDIQAARVFDNHELPLMKGGRRAVCPRSQCEREKQLRLRPGVRIEVVGVKHKPIGGGRRMGAPSIDYHLLITRGAQVYSHALGSDGEIGLPVGDKIAPAATFHVHSLAKQDVTGDGSNEVIVTFDSGQRFMNICDVPKRGAVRCTTPISMGTREQAKTLRFPSAGLVEIDGAVGRVRF